MDTILLVRVILGILCSTLARSACPSNCNCNTNCDLEPDGGCPLCREPYYGRQCEYRLECAYTTNGISYRGLINTTSSGLNCQYWGSDSPHNVTRRYKMFEGNFCRNNEIHVNQTWCYTTNHSVRWQYCKIPLCRTQCTAPPQPPGSIVLNPAKPGEGFYNGYTVYVKCPGNVNVTSVCRSNTWSTVSCPGTQCTAPPQPPGSIVLNPVKPGEGFKEGYTVYVKGSGNVNVTYVCRFSTWSLVSSPGEMTVTDKIIVSQNYIAGAGIGVGSTVAVFAIILIIVYITLKKKGLELRMAAPKTDRNQYEDYRIAWANTNMYADLGGNNP